MFGNIEDCLFLRVHILCKPTPLSEGYARNLGAVLSVIVSNKYIHKLSLDKNHSGYIYIRSAKDIMYSAVVLRASSEQYIAVAFNEVCFVSSTHYPE